MVWLMEHEGRNFAVKQFPKGQKGNKSYEWELQVQNVISECEKEHPGREAVSELVDCHQSSKDVWLVYPLGGKSLQGLLFDINGIFYKSERIYDVQYSPFY